MSKPDCILQIEAEFQVQLSLAPSAADCFRHRHQNSFAVNGEKVIGLHLRSDKIDEFDFSRYPDLLDLQTLNLSENGLQTVALPDWLTRLTHLNLSENASLKQLVFEKPLPALEVFDASECALESLVFPAGFDGLKKVELRKNQLISLDFKAACPHLTWLDASQNELTELRLPAGFEALEFLYLNDNKLELLDFATAPRRLEILHLRTNKLKELPANLLSITCLKTLYLHANEFQGSLSSVIPTDERANAFKTVTDYLLALRGGKIKNERVKIILVGNGRVGKTSLFRRLKGEDFNPNEQPTHGIQLGDLDKKNLPGVKTDKLQANVWDFGGQEIFYATHQLFLTDDALYILAWTAEENVMPHRERDKDLLPGEEKWRENGYWLENIRHHSKNSPLLMVQTHCDGQRTPVNPANHADEPYRAACLDFCAVDGDGLNGLKRLITKRLNTQIPHLGEDFPVSYDGLIGEIELIRGENKITRTRFDALCRKAEIPKDGEESVLKFLRLTGTVVWFEQVAALRDTIFINPNWLTKQVYALINKDLEAAEGRLTPDWVNEVLPDFSPGERTQLLVLLTEFQLIFEAKEEGTGVFIAPQYLPAALNRDAQIQFEKSKRRLAPAFVFHFPNFVPDNVMVNFLSRYGPYSDKIYWKSGISFTSKEETDCIVEFDEPGRNLLVFTSADEKSHVLQAEVCRAFVELSKNANAQIALEGKPLVAWQVLAKAEKDGFDKIHALDETPVSVSEYARFFGRERMFGGSKLPGEEGEAENRPSIFFSYAWGDDKEPGESREKIVDNLYDDLFTNGNYLLQRDKKKVGYKKSILDFMKKMGRGEFVVVVVSDKYLKSPYCMFELLEVYRKSNSDVDEFREKIFPVVLADAKIYDPLDRLDYVEFWQQRTRKLEEKINSVGLLAAKSAIPDFEIYAEIMQNAGNLAGIIADLNNLSPKLLAADSFAEIKKAIAERANKLQPKP